MPAYLIRDLSPLSVVPFSPVVSSPTLSMYEVVRVEDTAPLGTLYCVYCSWLQIYDNRPGHEPEGVLDVELVLQVVIVIKTVANETFDDL